jgi:hypothetical protein
VNRKGHVIEFYRRCRQREEARGISGRSRHDIR